MSLIPNLNQKPSKRFDGGEACMKKRTMMCLFRGVNVSH